MRFTTFMVTTATLAAAVPAAGQTDPSELAERIQTLTIEASVRGAAALHEAATLSERGLAAHPGDPWLLHYQGHALYRLAAIRACDEAADPRCVWRGLERAEEAFEASLAARPIAETYALLGSVYGLMIGESPALGATLGARIGDLQQEALALEPENPRVWLLKGIGQLYTPAAFGGGADVALASLERAARAFEADAPEPPAPRWGKADVHAWLGQVHAARGDTAAARAAYERALEIEPGHAWVRDVLLPGLAAGG
jgi:tetratricopeptide (TPR) repeat protein